MQTSYWAKDWWVESEWESWRFSLHHTPLYRKISLRENGGIINYQDSNVIYGKRSFESHLGSFYLEAAPGPPKNGTPNTFQRSQYLSPQTVLRIRSTYTQIRHQFPGHRVISKGVLGFSAANGQKTFDMPVIFQVSKPRVPSLVTYNRTILEKRS